MRHKNIKTPLYKKSIEVIFDKVLEVRAKGGDKDAFSKLYLKHFDSIYRYVFFRVNMNRQDAEDMTETVFLKAWEKIEGFDEEKAGFRPWIYKIARNLIVDFYRNNKKTTRLSALIIDERENVEQKVLGKIESDEILKAISQLSEEQKEVVVMKFIEGLKNGEISKVLGKKEEAVRSLQYRALKKLKEILK